MNPFQDTTRRTDESLWRMRPDPRVTWPNNVTALRPRFTQKPVPRHRPIDGYLFAMALGIVIGAAVLVELLFPVVARWLA